MDWTTLAIQYGVGTPGYIGLYYVGRWLMARYDKDLDSRIENTAALRALTEIIRNGSGLNK